MKIIGKLLVIMLMSMMTSVAFAQAPKKYDVAKLDKNDIAHIERAMKKNSLISVEDSILAVKLMHENNVPEKGVLANEIDFYNQAQIGDDWIAYISRDMGSFWLTYYFSRNGKFVGRVDKRLD